MSAYKRSVGAYQQKSYIRVYAADLDEVWQSTLEALKSLRIDTADRDAGMIQTKWLDNTSERNFAESTANDLYLKAQVRFKFTVALGEYRRGQGVRVTVQKEQLVQRDLLEPMHALESDGIEENTYLYRISQILLVRYELKRIDNTRVQQELERSPSP